MPHHCVQVDSNPTMVPSGWGLLALSILLLFFTDLDSIPTASSPTSPSVRFRTFSLLRLGHDLQSFTSGSNHILTHFQTHQDLGISPGTSRPPACGGPEAKSKRATDRGLPKKQQKQRSKAKKQRSKAKKQSKPKQISWKGILFRPRRFWMRADGFPLKS